MHIKIQKFKNNIDCFADLVYKTKTRLKRILDFLAQLF